MLCDHSTSARLAKSLAHRAIPSFLVLGLAGLATLAPLGCQPKPPELAPAKPPEVIVGKPFQEDIQEYEDFTGRTEAYRMAEVRARVSGYLDKVYFKDGSDIEEGAVIAEIDPRIYKATVEKATANVLQTEAHLKRLTSEFRRAERLTALKTITQEEFEKVAGDRSEAAAVVEAAKADLALANLNLTFARVTAPQSGRIGRRLVDPGNLIKADDTPLATIVSLDPIYASFDIDERTLLRLRRLARDGKIESAREGNIHVKVGLADEDGFSMDGLIDFVDTTLHPGTGSLRVRALVQNPRKMLSPGLFVRIRLPVGPIHKGWMVPEEALGTDQGSKLVYILNDKDEVVSRRVKQGVLQNGNREIAEGLGPDDRVIVSGLQRVRPGVKVAPKWAEEKRMKTGTPAGATNSSKEEKKGPQATSDSPKTGSPSGEKAPGTMEKPTAPSKKESETPKTPTTGNPAKESPSSTPKKENPGPSK